jgi:hypothetical protein
MPDSRTRSSRYFPGPHEDHGKAGGQRAADVRLDVIAVHDRLSRAHPDGAEHLLEEALGGLADDVGLVAGGELDRRDERADVE